MRTAALLVPLCLLVVGLLLPGCAIGRRADPRPPAAMITGPAGSGTLNQTGDAQTPATADTSAGSSGFTIPAGQPVTIAPDGVVSFTAAEPIRVTAQFSSFRASGPGAFTPPAPPTPADEATGRSEWVFRIALFAGLAAGVFGLVRGWDFVMYGGGAVGAAAAAALFIGRHPLLFSLIGAGFTAAVVGPWIWHTRLKRAQTSPAAAPAPA